MIRTYLQHWTNGECHTPTSDLCITWHLSTTRTTTLHNNCHILETTLRKQIESDMEHHPQYYSSTPWHTRYTTTLLNNTTITWISLVKTSGTPNPSREIALTTRSAKPLMDQQLILSRTMDPHAWKPWKNFPCETRSDLEPQERITQPFARHMPRSTSHLEERRNHAAARDELCSRWHVLSHTFDVDGTDSHESDSKRDIDFLHAHLRTSLAWHTQTSTLIRSWRTIENLSTNVSTQPTLTHCHRDDNQNQRYSNPSVSHTTWQK